MSAVTLSAPAARAPLALRAGAAPAWAVATFALAALSPAFFNDPDTWTHIAAGDWMLTHRAVAHVDPLSSSFAGKPWIAHEWLAEALLALAFRAAGYAGVALLGAGAAALAVFVVLRRAAKDLSGPALHALAALALMLLAPGLLARPHILALPVFALWAAKLADAGERAPPPALALLMTLWANLHGGFAFGLALIAPFAAEAVYGARERGRAARAWGVFAALAVAAAAITPFGLEGLAFPVRQLGLSALSRIAEWAPENFAKPNALEAALLGLLAVALTRPLKLPVFRLATLIGLFHLSLAHARHEQLLAIVAPLLLSKPLADALPAPAPAAPTDRRVAWAVAAALLAAAVLRLAIPVALPPAFASLRAALAALPADTQRTAGLNGYRFGGYLAFEGVRPYVDGRAELFGDAFLDDYARLARGERAALDAALPGANWTLFAPDQGAVAALDAQPGWRRVYADTNVVAHVRVQP